MRWKFLGRAFEKATSKRTTRRSSSRTPRFESLENRRVLAHLLNVEIVQVCNDNGTVCAELGPGDTNLAQPNEYAYEDEVNAILGQADIQVKFTYSRFNSSATLDVPTQAEGNAINSNGPGYRDFDGIQLFFVRKLLDFDPATVQEGFSSNRGFTYQGVVNAGLVAPTGRGLMANAGPARVDVAATIAHEIAHGLGLSHVNSSTGLPNDPLVSLNRSQRNLMWQSRLQYDPTLNNALIANNPLTQAQINAMIANGTNSRFDVLKDVPDVTVSIGAAGRDVKESAGTINVTATLSANATSAVTIPLSFGGTAGANDYDAVDNSITIASGSRTGTARIVIKDDNLDESNETIVVSFGTPSGGVKVSNGRQVITVVDDDVPPSIQFATTNLSATEGGGTISIPIQILDPINAAISLPYSVQSAAMDSEFEILSENPLVIPANATTATIQVRALSDQVVDPNESILLTLLKPSNATLGSANVATVTIVDVPPSPPVINFDDADVNFSISEGSTRALTVKLTLDKPAPAPVNASFTFGGTASDNDFTITATDVMIPQGGQSFSTEIRATLDSQNETTESITIELTGLTGAVLGDNAVQTISILDASDSENGNRILIPESLAKPQRLPGDNRPTAILFAAVSDTTVSVTSENAASGVQLLDQDLVSIGTSANGGIEAAVEAGRSYALIFPALTQPRIYDIQSADGFDALINSPSFNVLKPTDVNGDGNTTVVDAIRVINRINARPASGESTPSGLAYSFEDVSGDGVVTAVDALRIINELNSAASSELANTEPVDSTLVALAVAGVSVTKVSESAASPIEEFAFASVSTSKCVGGAKTSNDRPPANEIDLAIPSTGKTNAAENANDDALKITDDWLGLDR